MMKYQLPVRYSIRPDYELWLRGVRDMCQLLGWRVDDMAWGGGIPGSLTLIDPQPDEPDAEDEPDTAALADSARPPPDSEP